jgi:hypothetical protein
VRSALPRIKAAALLATIALLVLAALWTGASFPAASSAAGSASAASTLGSTEHPAAPVAAASAAAAVPSAAPALTAPGLTPAAVSLNWQDGTTGTFTNYTVQEASQTSSWEFKTIATFTSDATTSMVVAGLTSNTSYDWQVVEYYETCTLIICNGASVTTNVLNQTQPTLAYLDYTGLTSSNVTLHWTNNATYGGLLSFDEYVVYEASGTGSPAPLEPITSEATRSLDTDLVSGTSYSFYVVTTDCSAGCGTGSPTLSSTQSNVITLGPPQTLSVTVLAQNPKLDLGQSDFFTCTATGGKSPFSYEWTFGSASPVAGGTSESTDLSGLGVNTVTCQVTDADSDEASGSADVTVNPTLEVTASVNRSSADVGQAVTFTCYAQGGWTPYIFSWVYGDGDTSNVGNATHAYLTAGGFSPSCEVTDNVGSSSDPSFAVLVSPALSASVTASSEAAAPGTSLTFTADPVNGSGTYSMFSWKFGGGGTASGREVTHAFASLGTRTVDVAVTDSNGATASSSVTVVVSDISIAVTPTVTAANTGASITFTASASGGAGAPYNYTWSFGEGAFGYGATVRHAYSGTGTVVPTLVVTDRLGATNQTTLPTIHLTAAPAPLANLAGWLILLLGVLVAVVVGFVVLTRRRAAEASALAAGTAWVPPTDPKRTIRGRKICPSCGANNLPIRSTCSHCGKPLPRSPG